MVGCLLVSKLNFITPGRRAGQHTCTRCWGWASKWEKVSLCVCGPDRGIFGWENHLPPLFLHLHLLSVPVHLSPADDKHKFFKSSNNFPHEFGARLYSSSSWEEEKSSCNPDRPHSGNPATPPLPMSLKCGRWWWQQKQEIRETLSMTPLICFDVSTSKKLRKKSGRYVWFADKAMTHGLKSALSYFVLFDIWLLNTYHPQEKLQSAGPKLHLNIIPASHTHIQTIVSSPPLWARLLSCRKVQIKSSVKMTSTPSHT